MCSQEAFFGSTLFPGSLPVFHMNISSLDFWKMEDTWPSYSHCLSPQTNTRHMSEARVGNQLRKPANWSQTHWKLVSQVWSRFAELSTCPTDSWVIWMIVALRFGKLGPTIGLCFCKWNFNRTQPHPFLYILSEAVFSLSQQSQLITTGILWP